MLQKPPPLGVGLLKHAYQLIRRHKWNKPFLLFLLISFLNGKLGVNTADPILFAMFPDLSEAVQYHIQWELGNIPGWIIVVLVLILFGAARLSGPPVNQEPGEG